jgi:lysophospholipase L1-like esterase
MASVLTLTLAVLTASVSAWSDVPAAASGATGPPHDEVRAEQVSTPHRPVRSIAVVGDSISQGTGSNGPGSPGGGLGEQRPTASWATGNHRGLDSYADRLDAISAAPIVRHNLSENGSSMRDDFYDQVTRLPDDVDVVLVQMGGNDLCRSSEDRITAPEVFEREFRRGLGWLSEHRPDALVLVGSVPDVYSLWYVRGAPHQGEQWPLLDLFVPGGDGPRPPRTATENDNKRLARLIWNTLGLVPCATMLDDANRPRNAGPTPDPADPAEQRRLRVRAVTQRYNEILADECERVLRCRFDDAAIFDLMANRDAAGELLADPTQWTFTDADISTQDHFHPSFQGQRKLAAAMWRAGFDWSDTTAPTVRLTTTRGGRVDDVTHLAGPSPIRVTASDDRAVRGIEYRTAALDEPLESAPWTAVVGPTAMLGIDAPTRAAVRAVDVNGNVGESVVTTLLIDTDAPRIEIVVDDVVHDPHAPHSGPTNTGAHRHLTGALSVVGAVVPIAVRCEDSGSGVGQCSLESGRRAGLADTASVRTTTIGASASDRVGNVADARVEHHIVYRWTSAWLDGDGSDAPPAGVRRAGRVEVVRFSLSDASGRAITDAELTVGLRGPDGRMHRPTSPLSILGLETPRWSRQLGAYVAVIGTATLRDGDWTVVVEADDGGRIESTIRVG